MTDPTTSLQNNIQTNIQYGLINKLSTGNPIIDSMIYVVISMIMTTFIASMLNWMKEFFLLLSNKISYIFTLIWKKINNMFNKQHLMNKSVEIAYITEEKKVNQLYKAVDWYLASKHEIDYIKETPLRMSYEDEIDGRVIENIKINKRPTMNNCKNLTYEGYEISFITNKDVITVYTDKERKRENYKITLSTQIPINATEDILEKFCTFCVNEYMTNKNGRTWQQYVYTNNESGCWESSLSYNKRKLETVVLQNGLLQEIRDDIDDFIKSEDWYHEWGIPYTRGYLLYGKPGCGKTSLIKGLSNYTKRHMHYLMLNNVRSDNDLIELLKKITYKETILIIEDIDCMTKIIEDRNKKESEDYGKLKEEINQLKQTIVNNNGNGNCNSHLLNIKDTSQKSNLTLSGLLNAIDGIFNNDGRILIMTTNHPEVLDDALLRPGRIDKKIKFDYSTKEQIKNMYKMMFNKDYTYQMDHIEDYQYSPAEIVALFVKHKTNPHKALELTELNSNKINFDLE